MHFALIKLNFQDVDKQVVLFAKRWFNLLKKCEKEIKSAEVCW